MLNLHIKHSPTPNIYKHHTGKPLTPLLQENIQYHKTNNNTYINKEINESIARHFQILSNDRTNWAALLKLLKKYEGEKKI